MRCDNAISKTCDALGSLSLIEEILNSVFGKLFMKHHHTHILNCNIVFVIRFAERKIDQLLDTALLDYSPLSSEFDSIQFEGEWSLFRSFASGKKKANGTASTPTSKGGVPMSPTQVSRPPSPTPQPSTSPNTRGFASFRQTLTRARGASSATPLQSLFAESQPPPTSPKDIISFMTALHSLLILAGVNPALIVQFWSQVMYWTACEYRHVDYLVYPLIVARRDIQSGPDAQEVPVPVS